MRFRQVDTGQSFPALEERVLARWRERDIFHETLRRREGGPVFVFYEGPPTANGEPGSHHVLSRVFKDIFPRYKTMCGYHVSRKAGWDCHGLPVELEIERKLGIKSKEEIENLGIAEFNGLCRESVLRYVGDWNRLTERIGFWIDLDDPYVTMSNEYVESVWWSLRQMWDRGLLFEDHKVGPYCPRCGTNLSSHEVALGYKEVEDPSVYIRFPLEGSDASLLVWTTTPWTLAANVAVAIHPDIAYVKVRSGEEKLVVAEPLVERVLGEGAEIVERLAASDLAGSRYEPPFDFFSGIGGGAHAVYAADFVTTGEGTGLVHIAPAFGEDDLRVAREHGLPVVNPVNLDGTYTHEVGDLAGMWVKDADARVIESLDRAGKVFRVERLTHSYPHCWRCETPLLYYAKSSWYVRTTALRDRLLAENETINWHPPHIKHGRFGKWLENNVDWALSRERYWGTPLPIWRCEAGHAECIGSLEELRDRANGAVPEDVHRPHIDSVEFDCRECGGGMRRVPDVIDAWYDSGSMPFAQWHYPFENAGKFADRFPAQFICEAIDQTRGWFYSLLAVSTILFDRAPYENVLCLGLILDEDGHKMSKSRGNVVAPWEVIDRHGADALRWYYFTSQAPWAGYRFSIDAVGESVRQFLLTLWNTYGFFILYANIDDFDPLEREISVAERPPLDRFALSRLQGTVARVRERLDDYDTTAAGRAIAEYVDELSNWYVRRSRRRFWRSAGDSEAERDKACAYLTLHECLVTLSKLLAPFTPFLADEIFTNLDGSEESVHLCDFPESAVDLIDEEIDFAMAKVRETVRLGLAARSRSKVKVRQPLPEAAIVADSRERAAIEAHDALVRDELNVKRLTYVDSASQLGRYEVKPNFRSLGPRFGREMRAVAAAIARLDPASVAASLERGERIELVVEGGRKEMVSPEDLQLAMLPLDGYSVEREARHAVAVKTEIDRHLRLEGLAREVVHAVQGARRAAGLEVEDRIDLRLDCEGDLARAIEEFRQYVAGETLALSIDTVDPSNGEFHRREVDVEGSRLVVALRAHAGGAR